MRHWHSFFSLPFGSKVSCAKNYLFHRGKLQIWKLILNLVGQEGPTIL